MKTKNADAPVRRSVCDIRRKEDTIVMRLEMPGVGKDGLEVNVDGNSLVIEGRRKAEADRGEWLVREIRAGDFRMEFTIDETIDRDAIRASLDRGVLTVSLGLSEAVKPRKIAIAAK